MVPSSPYPKRSISIFLVLLFFFPVISHASEIPVATESVAAGGSVSARGESVDLYDGTLKAGDDFLALVAGTDLEFPFTKKVTVVSIVPSVDTRVCEAQTHILGEAGLPEGIDRVTISRDLPMAQKRFAADAGLTNITFVSDYRSGSFGKSAGLMMKGRELLTRAVLVLDEAGNVRHLQIVPEVSSLPDMQAAFDAAQELVSEEAK